ncbi:MAG: protein-glutamate O-methyltransferase [Deltaproteobacteria bacterium]|nr:protein-glutamate O-methyltransferase [Deltaproteobacteria bacterium]
MDEVTFNRFRQIIYKLSGISLGTNKEALVSARVAKRMRVLGIPNHREYLRYVIQDKSGEEIIHLLDVISTNVTDFFRESDHFAFLKKVVSDWLAAGQRRFRFWSAACSSGEEPYSIAMTLLEATNSTANTDIKILATDISTSVLDNCRTGTYDKEKLKPVPSALRERYFDQYRDDHTTYYTAKARLKDLVVFSMINLSTPPFPMSGPFDAVFCRNVMIYFDNNVRKNLLDEIYRLLKPGGYLMVGHAESLSAIESDFKLVKSSIYIKE